jgi:hypothetical protein
METNAKYQTASSISLPPTNQLQRLMKDAALGRNVKDVLARKQFFMKESSKQFIAAGLSHAPAFEQVFPCIMAAFANEIGLELSPSDIANSSPSAQVLREIIQEGAADCLILLQEELKEAPAFFLGCDKGLRKGVDHFAKVLSWYCKRDHKIKNFLLDIDGSGSKSTEAAKAIKNSCFTRRIAG